MPPTSALCFSTILCWGGSIHFTRDEGLFAKWLATVLHVWALEVNQYGFSRAHANFEEASVANGQFIVLFRKAIKPWKTIFKDSSFRLDTPSADSMAAE